MCERPLTGKSAIVTGATSGIGRAIALALTEGGVVVHALGRRDDALRDLCQLSSNIHSHQVDLESDDDLRCFASSVNDVDILVHSAGVIKRGALKNLPVSDFDRHYRINLRAPYLLTQLLFPKLVVGDAQIVFINSSAGITAGSLLSQYSASKFGLKAIADSLRAEVNVLGVRVISVYPGQTATPMQAELRERHGQRYQPEVLLQPEDIAAAVINALTMPRTAEITDIYIRPMKKP